MAEFASIQTVAANMFEDMEETQAACQHVYERIKAASEALTQPAGPADGEKSPPSKLIEQFTCTLNKFEAFTSLYAGRPLYARVVGHHNVMNELRNLHEEIGKLLQSAQQPTPVVWKMRWEQEQLGQVSALGVTLDDVEAVRACVQDDVAQAEAMIILQHELNRQQVRGHSEQTVEMIRKLLQVISCLSCGQAPVVPPWFLSLDDLVWDKTTISHDLLGAVYRGELKSGKKVLIKTFDVTKMTPTLHELIEKEVEVWANLQHPNVIKILGACHVTPKPFVVFDEISGQNIVAYLSSCTVTRRVRTWTLLYEAALGLEYIHGSDIVLQDLQLSDIVIGEDGTTRIVGFTFCKTAAPSANGSLARPHNEFVKESGLDEFSSGGSLDPQAPECTEGRPTRASNVFSFGVNIVEVITASATYSLRPGEQTDKSELPSHSLPNAELPDDVRQLLRAMTAFDPQRRPSMTSVVSALASLVRNLGVSTSSIAETTNTSKDRMSQAMTLITVLPSPGDHAGGAITNQAENDRMKARKETSDGLSAGEFVRLLAAVGSQESATKSLYRMAMDKVSCHAIKNAGGYRLLLGSIQDASTTEVQKLYAFGCLHRINSYNDCDEVVWMKDIKSVLATLSRGIRVEQFVAAIAQTTNDQDIQEAVELMTCLALTGEQGQNKLREAGVMPHLVRLLQSGSDKQVVESLLALRVLVSGNESNQRALSAIGVVPVLVSQLVVGNDEQILNATLTLAEMGSPVDSIRAEIAVAGATKLLITLMRDGNDDQKAASAKALSNLCLNDDIATAIVKSDGIASMVELLQHGTAPQKSHVVAALSVVSQLSRGQAAIARAGGIGPLVSLLCVGTEAQKRHALTAICRLTTHKSILPLLVKVGLVDPLVEFLCLGSDDEKEQAALALAHLATDDNGRDAILESSATEALVELVESGNELQKRHALEAFLLIGADDDNLLALLKPGAIEALVDLILAGSSEHVEAVGGVLRAIVSSPEYASMGASSQSIVALVKLLRTGSDEEQDIAIEALARVTAMGSDYQLMVTQADAIAPIVALLGGGKASQVTAACEVLHALASTKEARLAIADAGAIEPLFELLASASIEQRHLAASTLGRLALDCQSQLVIVEAGGLAPMAELLRCGGDDHRQVASFTTRIMKRDDDDETEDANDVELLRILGSSSGCELQLYAVSQLERLSRDRAKRMQMIEDVETIELLMKIVRRADGNATAAMAALRNLTTYHPFTVGKNRGVIELLIEVLKSGSDDLKESAVRVLSIVGGACPDTIVQAGGIVALVDLLKCENDDDKEHAASALKTIAHGETVLRLIAEAGACAPIIDFAITSDSFCSVCSVLEVLNVVAGDENTRTTLKSVILNVLEDLRGSTKERWHGFASMVSNMYYDALKDLVGEAGAAVPLIQLLTTGEASQRDVAQEALDRLNECDVRAELATTLSPLVDGLKGDNDAKKEYALGVLANLSESSHACSLIIEAGVLVLLTSLVVEGTEEQKGLSARLLGNLAHDRDARKLIMDLVAGPVVDFLVGAFGTKLHWRREHAYFNILNDRENVNMGVALRITISRLVEELGSGDDAHIQHAGQVLLNIAKNSSLRALVSEVVGIAPLIQLLKAGTNSAKEYSVRILASLAQYDAFRISISEEGWRVLVDYLTTCNDTHMETLTEAVADLLEHEEACAKLTEVGIISPLVERLKSGNDEVKAYVLQILGEILKIHPAREAAYAAGAVEFLSMCLTSDIDTHKSYAAKALARMAQISSVLNQVVSTDTVEPMVQLLVHSAPEAIGDLVCEPRVRVELVQSIQRLTEHVRTGSDAQLADALHTLISLTKYPETRLLVLEAGAVESLVERQMASTSTYLQHDLMRWLWSNCNDEASFDDILMSAILPHLEDLKMSEGTLRLDAAWRLSRTVKHRMLLTSGALRPLVQLLRDDDGKREWLAEMLKELTCVIVHDDEGEVRAHFASDGDFVALIDLLQIGNDANKEAVMRALRTLGNYEEFSARLVAETDAVTHLVQVVQCSNTTLESAAAEALVSLVVNDIQAAEMIAEAVTITYLVERITCGSWAWSSSDLLIQLAEGGWCKDLNTATVIAEASVGELRTGDSYDGSKVIELLLVLSDGEDACRAMAAAGVIEALSDLVDSEEAKVLIDKIRAQVGAIDPPSEASKLVNDLNAAVCADATQALNTILTFLQDNDSACDFVTCDTINSIAEYVASEADEASELAIQILQFLGDSDAAAYEHIVQSGAIEPLAQVSSKRKLPAMALLRRVCENDTTSRPVAREALDIPVMIDMCGLNAPDGSCARGLMLEISRAFISNDDELELLRLLIGEGKNEDTTLVSERTRALQDLFRDKKFSTALLAQLFQSITVHLSEGSVEVKQRVVRFLVRLPLSYVDAADDAGAIRALIKQEMDGLSDPIDELLCKWTELPGVPSRIPLELLLPVADSHKWARTALWQSLKATSPPAHQLACGLAELSDINSDLLADSGIGDRLAVAWANLSRVTSAEDASLEVVVHAPLIASLVEQAQSKKAMAGLLCRLTRFPVYQGAVIEAAGIPIIVDLLYDNSFVGEAARALAQLAKASDSTRVAILEAGGIGPLVELAKKSGEEREQIRRMAASTLAALASNRGALTVIHALDGLNTIAEFVRTGTAQERADARRILRPLYRRSTTEE